MTEQEINNLIDSKIGKTKMSQLPEATQTSGLYSIGYTGNQSVKYKANLLQGDPLTVRKTYQTEAEALADKNPIDPTTSLPLKIGQFVSIVDDGEKNGIYRIGSIDGNGTMSLELQGKLGDLSGYTKTGGSTKTTKEIDDLVSPLADSIKLTDSKNLFNPAAVQVDKYVSSTDGSISSVAGWKCSAFIPVVPGQVYTLSGSKERTGFAFYDASFTPVRYLNLVTGTVTAQTGEVYAAFNLESPAQPGYSNIQFEKGSPATSYEPFKRLVAKEGVEGLEQAMSDIQSAVEATVEINDKIQVFEFNTNISTNLLNPNAVTPNSLVSDLDGTVQIDPSHPTIQNYNTTDFMPVNPSTAYRVLNINASEYARKAAFYDASKVYVSGLDKPGTNIPVPAGVAYCRISIKNDSPMSGYGFFEGASATWEPFGVNAVKLAKPRDINNKTDKELVSKGDVNNLINTALSQESGSLSLQISNTSNADVIINDGGVSVTMGVNQSISYQGLINFTGVDAFGLVYSNFDDIAPVHIQNYTIGANHGWGGNILTCVGHGLTESNVGDELTANDGVKFTVMKINSVDTFTVFRENEGSSIYFHSNTGWDGQTSLTDGVTIYTITDSISRQYYPSVNKKYVKIFKDRKEVVANGSFYADIAELVEEYDILNKESLRLNAATPENALSSINVKNTYQFRKGGISYVFCRYKIGHELVFSNIMAAQAVMLSTAGYFYAPKILPFPDSVDLRRLTLFSALGGVSRTFNDTLWESGKIPNRVTNYTADKTKALMLGILTDRGVGKNLASFTKDTFEIRGNSGKTYPHPVSSSAVGSTLTGGEIYDIAMFRAYFEPIGNVDKVELPLESKTIVIVDIHEVGTFTVKLSDNLNGGLINVTDSQNAIMHGDIVVNSEIEITTSNDYSYIEFEVH